GYLYQLPDGRGPADQSAKQEVGGVCEIDQAFGREVNGDGIYADDDKWKRPFSKTRHIDDKIEYREEHDTPTACIEYEAAGPDTFVDGQDQSPRIAKHQ